MKRKYSTLLTVIICCCILSFVGIKKSRNKTGNSGAPTHLFSQSQKSDTLHNAENDSAEKGGIILVDPRDRVNDYVLLDNSAGSKN